MAVRSDEVVRLARAVAGFALVSGAGLLIDFGIFALLVRVGPAPAVANLISASAAVTFVYFASVSRVFSYRGRLLLPLFAAYAVYQVIAVGAASVLVGYLAAHYLPPLIAKLAVLPLTFSANFLFMSALTARAQVAKGD